MYDVNGKLHNQKCVAHAIGCAVQNTQDLITLTLQAGSKHKNTKCSPAP